MVEIDEVMRLVDENTKDAIGMTLAGFGICESEIEKISSASMALVTLLSAREAIEDYVNNLLSRNAEK